MPPPAWSRPGAAPEHRPGLPFTVIVAFGGSHDPASARPGPSQEARAAAGEVRPSWGGPTQLARPRPPLGWDPQASPGKGNQTVHLHICVSLAPAPQAPGWVEQPSRGPEPPGLGVGLSFRGPARNGTWGQLEAAAGFRASSLADEGQGCWGRGPRGREETRSPPSAVLGRPGLRGQPCCLRGRRGSSVALMLDVRSLGAVEPICSVRTPQEVTLHFLRTAGRPLSRQALQRRPPSPTQLEEEFLVRARAPRHCPSGLGVAGRPVPVGPWEREPQGLQEGEGSTLCPAPHSDPPPDAGRE